MIEEETRQNVYSLLLLGDTMVGKTCFLLRFCNNVFQETHLTTMGLEFKEKKVEIESDLITVKLWDTVGQERFKSLTRNFYKNVFGIALMYDVTNKNTFNSIASWLVQIKDKASPNVQVILIGNKIDEIDNREVLTEEGQKLGEKYQLAFYEASAKDNVNVVQSIMALVEKVYQNKMSNTSNLDLKKGKKSKNKEGCCS